MATNVDQAADPSGTSAVRGDDWNLRCQLHALTNLVVGQLLIQNDYCSHHQAPTAITYHELFTNDPLAMAVGTPANRSP